MAAADASFTVPEIALLPLWAAAMRTVAAKSEMYFAECMKGIIQ
jgi:hypothetical protein